MKDPKILSKNQINKDDLVLAQLWKRSPVRFIGDIWGLDPQPVRDEYRASIRDTALEDYRPEWFEPFVRGKNISWQQWVILLGVERGIRGEAQRRLSIRSGRGIGKSCVLSWLIIWFLTVHLDANILCTAPSSEQMHDALWKEVALWIQRMPKRVQSLYEWQTNYVRMKERPQTWFARARTARKENPEALAGLHSKHMMFVVDEASGVDDIIFKHAEGGLTDENVFFIMISNPTRLIGYFHDTHNSKDSYNWQTFRFNSEDAPDSISNKDSHTRLRDKYGDESDEYKVHVLGEFPRADAVDDAGYVPLFSRDILHKAPTRELAVGRRLGIDPSGEGRDFSQWVARDRYIAKKILTERKSSAKSIAAKTLTLMDYHKIRGSSIWVDNLGQGANVSQEISYGNEYVNAVSFADKADDRARFLNKRAEMYFRVKEWCANGGELVDDDLIDELLTIKYRVTHGGKYQIMSKKDMRKSGTRSPDLADALALTFYEEEFCGIVGEEPRHFESGRRHLRTRMMVDDRHRMI